MTGNGIVKRRQGYGRPKEQRALGLGLAFCQAPGPSQPPHHLLHPVLPDVGVNLGGVDGGVPQQGLDVHQLGPGVEQVVASVGSAHDSDPSYPNGFSASG